MTGGYSLLAALQGFSPEDQQREEEYKYIKRERNIQELERAYGAPQVANMFQNYGPGADLNEIKYGLESAKRGTKYTTGGGSFAGVGAEGAPISKAPAHIQRMLRERSRLPGENQGFTNITDYTDTSMVMGPTWHGQSNYNHARGRAMMGGGGGGEAPMEAAPTDEGMSYADFTKRAAALDTLQRDSVSKAEALRGSGINPASFAAMTPLQQGEALSTILASTKSTPKPRSYVFGEDVTEQMKASRPNRLDPRIANILGALAENGVDSIKALGATNQQREDYLKNTGTQYSKMIHSGELETRADANGRMIPHMKIRETVQDPNGFGEKTVYNWVPLNPQQLRDYAMSRGAGFISDTPQMFQEPAARPYSSITPSLLQDTGQFDYAEPIGPQKPAWMTDTMSPLDRMAVGMHFGPKQPTAASILFNQHSNSPLSYRY